MKNELTPKLLGTLCFFESDNLADILSEIEALKDIFCDEWHFLIISSDQIKDNKAAKKLSSLSCGSAAIKHLNIKKDLEFQKVVPTAFKVLSAINFVKTPFISFVDSNYKISKRGLANLTKIIRQKDSFGAIAAEVLRNEKPFVADLNNVEGKLFEVGEGIREFGLLRLSSIGIFYNVPLLKKTKILDRFEENLRAHRDYPWVFLNILLAANTQTYISSEAINIVAEDNTQRHYKMTDYFSERSYGQRCDQLIALRNTLFEAFIDSEKQTGKKRFDISEFYASYIELFQKMIPLIIEENRDTYLDQMMSVNLIARSFSIFCLAAIKGFPEYNQFNNYLHRAIFPVLDKLTEILNNNEENILETSNSLKKSVFYSRV